MGIPGLRPPGDMLTSGYAEDGRGEEDDDRGEAEARERAVEEALREDGHEEEAHEHGLGHVRVPLGLLGKACHEEVLVARV